MLANFTDADKASLYRRRNAAVNAMACCLGIPRGKSYYYMICFEHAKASGNATMGLGSDNGTLAKDCGYYFDQNAPGLAFRAGGPFGDVRRHRCVNNYWIWIMVSWGQWLFGLPQYQWMTTNSTEVCVLCCCTAADCFTTVSCCARCHQGLSTAVRAC